MKSRIAQFFPLLLFCLAIGVRYYAVWCINTTGTCYGSVIHQYALSLINPLYSYALWALIPSAVVIFVRPEVFKYWLKFAIGWVLFSFALLSAVPVYPAGGFMNIYASNRGEQAVLFGQVFAVLSIIVIAWKYWRLRRKNKSV